MQELQELLLLWTAKHASGLGRDRTVGQRCPAIVVTLVNSAGGAISASIMNGANNVCCSLGIHTSLVAESSSLHADQNGQHAQGT